MSPKLKFVKRPLQLDQLVTKKLAIKDLSDLRFNSEVCPKIGQLRDMKAKQFNQFFNEM